MNSLIHTPKKFRLWENPKNWIDRSKAWKFIPFNVANKIPVGAKILVISGGENADAWMYNDFKGGIWIWICNTLANRVGWRHFDDEDTAYQTFLLEDDWA